VLPDGSSRRKCIQHGQVSLLLDPRLPQHQFQILAHILEIIALSSRRGHFTDPVQQTATAHTGGIGLVVGQGQRDRGGDLDLDIAYGIQFATHLTDIALEIGHGTLQTCVLLGQP